MKEIQIMEKTKYNPMDINLKAMDKMAEIHDSLKAFGYEAHELEVYLVRLLFCLFADDTDIFPENAFYDYVMASRGDGSDLSSRLAELFFALDTKAEERKLLEPELQIFPYINGRLFEERLPERSIDGSFMLLLLTCKEIPWREISPAIFGAMFQEIMNQQTRREWGSYYTSEENIRKLIGPLFLDELWEEWKHCRGNGRRMRQFHDKLSQLTFFDPACGCGNFLIITYQELRRLEMEVVKAIYGTEQRVLDVGMYCRVNVGQFYGIELEAFQAQIARVGMWLADHQLNLEAAEYFGMYYARIPLAQSAEIYQGNALTTDWSLVIPAEKLNYIIGNPPFVGARLMKEEQKKDLRKVFGSSRASGNMDYVTGWYQKAANYMAKTGIRAAFVSTNSICQGEQACLLWKSLKLQYNIGIDFAYQTFVWNNEAKGQAKVHCVIIGFSDWSVRNVEGQKKRLIDGNRERLVPHINAYLLAAPDVYVESRRKPLADVPPMSFGSMANDGGHLILTPSEAADLVGHYPALGSAIRSFVGSEEYINGKERCCLWLLGIHPDKYRDVPEVQERIDAVRQFRLFSPREATRKLAKYPELFGEIRQPEKGRYILVPRVSSWRRSYIPMGFVSSSIIASDAALIIPDATAALFGILTSSMHMAWVRAIAGRLKSDYRYSASIVYNTFPFPEMTEEQEAIIGQLAEKVLQTRDEYASETLAWLYDDKTMPEDLRRAHRELDKAVDRAYGRTFAGEEDRITYLMERYASMTGE